MFEFNSFGEALNFAFFVAEADVCVLYGGSRWVSEGWRLVLCTNQPEPKQ